MKLYILRTRLYTMNLSGLHCDLHACIRNVACGCVLSSDKHILWTLHLEGENLGTISDPCPMKCCLIVGRMRDGVHVQQCNVPSWLRSYTLRPDVSQSYNSANHFTIKPQPLVSVKESQIHPWGGSRRFTVKHGCQVNDG